MPLGSFAKFSVAGEPKDFNMTRTENSLDIEQALDLAESEQKRWAGKMIRRRLRAIGNVAQQLAESVDEIAAAINRPNATKADLLSSEIIPLADACKFAAKQGRQLLAPRSLSWFQAAWWMGRISVTTLREPWGTVLILAPSNYPLFLPGVQVIQALAAGNAVLVKPAPGCALVMHRFRECLLRAGIPKDLVQVLPTSIESGKTAIELGVDKVVLTGSVETGRAVLRHLAESLIPSTMELSGCDAAFVTPQADLQRAAQALAFGLQLNGGATCIAPRRIFLTPENKDEFVRKFLAELQSVGARSQAAKTSQAESRQLGSYWVSMPVAQQACKLVEKAVSQGAKIMSGTLPTLPGDSTERVAMQPIVLDDVLPSMELAGSDLFAPVVSLINVPDMATAVNQDKLCPYSLGASVFGPKSYAEHWASQLAAGCVVLNDVIAPTADPRVAFGGRDHSGWGVTRGAEGILEMTRLKTICMRRGRWLPHLDPENAQNADMLSQLLKLLHGGSWRIRWSAMRAIMSMGKNAKSSKRQN